MNLLSLGCFCSLFLVAQGCTSPTAQNVPYLPRSSAGCDKSTFIRDTKGGQITSHVEFDRKTFYQPNSFCRWRITAPNKTEHVSIQFEWIDLDQSSDCIRDSVKIFDSNIARGRVLATLCGNKLPAKNWFTSSKDVILIQFETDGDTQKTGFQLNFWSGCGKPSEDPTDDIRIMGGHEVKPHSWPWQIQMRDQHNYLQCGATLITPQWVYTAAHCFDRETDNALKAFTLKFGAHNLHGDGTSIRLENTSLFIDKNYDHNKIMRYVDHDYALIHLSKPVPMLKEVLPICLPKEPLKTSHPCYVTGWGSKQATVNDLPNALQQVWVPYIRREICGSHGWYENRITHQMICAGHQLGKMDACPGDSGGPLACKVNNTWELHGIVSWGEGCGRPMKPGVYSDVLNGRGWMYRVMSQVWPEGTINRKA